MKWSIFFTPLCRMRQMRRLGTATRRTMRKWCLQASKLHHSVIWRLWQMFVRPSCSREMLKCTAFHPGVTVAGRPLRRFDRQWYGVSLSLITKSLEIVACIVLDFGNCCISTMEKHFVASCNKCTAVSLKKSADLVCSISDTATCSECSICCHKFSIFSPFSLHKPYDAHVALHRHGKRYKEIFQKNKKDERRCIPYWPGMQVYAWDVLGMPSRDASLSRPIIHYVKIVSQKNHYVKLAT